MGYNIVVEVEEFQCCQITHNKWKSRELIVGEIESGQRNRETCLWSGKVGGKLCEKVVFHNEVLDF